MSPARDQQRPIFILGCPRSGTRLVSRVLGGYPGHFLITEHGDKARVCPEDMSGLVDHYLWWANFKYPGWSGAKATRPPVEDPIHDEAAIGKVRNAYLALAAGRRLVVKNPAHVLRVPLIKEMFHDAMFAFVVREPWSTLQSIALKGPDNDSYWLKTERVRQLPNDVLLKAAVTWQEAVDSYVRHHDSSWTLVRYEKLLKEPADTVEGLFRTLAIPDDGYRTQAAGLPRERASNLFPVVRLFQRSKYQREILAALAEGCERFGYRADPDALQVDASSYYVERVRNHRVVSAIRRRIQPSRKARRLVRER